jgi:hypothetical protein
MLSALIKAQPRKDGNDTNLAIVTTKRKEKKKKADGVKEKKPRKNKVVPASDNESDEVDFSEFVPLENVPTAHYDGYVDEDNEMCGILSPERDEDVYAKKESEWSEFVKEEEERYDEEYDTSSATSPSVEGSLTSIEPDDDYGVDSYDSLSIDGDSLDPSDDDIFDSYSHKKKEPKQNKVKTFNGIAIFEDTDWIP